jgi:hypothetical protein
MKTLVTILGLLSSLSAEAASLQTPKLKLEQSVALDIYCPTSVTNIPISPLQLALVAKLPIYRESLEAKVPWFQAEWDSRGPALLQIATEIVGKPFPMKDLEAALFLCPTLPFMGTPLAFNVTSYLDVTAKEVGLPKANDVFYFVSTAFHEVLHKYIKHALSTNGSAILASMTEDELYEAHLHLFALQKRVLEKAGLASRLWEIEIVEASHGTAYARAWKAVHGNPKLEADLISELQK